MPKEGDVRVRELGYERLGGSSTQMYWSRERAEILKLAVRQNAEERADLLESFRRCLATSRVYATEGLMPEVLDVGEDFAGRATRTYASGMWQARTSRRRT